MNFRSAIRKTEAGGLRTALPVTLRPITQSLKTSDPDPDPIFLASRNMNLRLFKHQGLRFFLKQLNIYAAQTQKNWQVKNSSIEVMVNEVRAFLKRFPILVRIKRYVWTQKDQTHDFLYYYFKSNLHKTIVQIGANDGEICDPLRPFLKIPGNYQATLVEPLPFYINKLKSLYCDRPDIKIVNAAIGEHEGTGILYFIPPLVADLMNGDGPVNNWAHGQGSFDKNNLIYWIQKNNFRGDEYSKNIPFFLSCIESIEVPILRTADVLPNCKNLLMVIDVQGFELQVLNGLDWSKSPAYIMLEDDLGKSDSIFTYLEEKGYKYLCGKLDKVFVHSDLPPTSPHFQ